MERHARITSLSRVTSELRDAQHEHEHEHEHEVLGSVLYVQSVLARVEALLGFLREVRRATT
jgi:hypothetical protein